MNTNISTAGIVGLTSSDVLTRKAAGLSNDNFDIHSTTYLRIVLNNIFSVINIVITPLVIALAFYQLYSDALAFSVFLIINTLVSVYDEMRTKGQLDKLKKQFQRTANVIRDGKLQTIPAAEVVSGEFVLVKEGEGVIADGQIVASKYLQLDESMLTGESDYIQKEPGEYVMAGGFVVTGYCVYTVEAVGENNYLNKLSAAALGSKGRSALQINGDKLISVLVITALLVAGINYGVATWQKYPMTDRLLGLTTIISLIIPQTLIFLFTLTFTVSSIRLYRRGVLVQKTGSIPDLSEIDVICFDKTGTLTTNKMYIKEVAYFNVDSKEVGTFYNSVKDEIVGVNKTQELLHSYFAQYDPITVSDVQQIPFNSKNKYSLVSALVGKYRYKVLFGAASILGEYITDKRTRTDVLDYIQQKEADGNRVLLGLFDKQGAQSEGTLLPKTSQAMIFTIEEDLNPGINSLIAQLQEQGIEIKIISGDSLKSVARIAQKVGFASDALLDLSATNNEDFAQLAIEKTIFTRAKPEDKAAIVNALKAQGYKVAMVGDGINDVLGLKAADVSISMESGANITREVADLVLLSNNYQRIPTIFYEGENIIFNLKLSTKLFLAKACMGILLGLFFSLILQPVPLHPASTLIFSFLGTSAPSYVLVFTRQKVKNSAGFFTEIFNSALPVALIMFLCAAVIYLLSNNHEPELVPNTAIVIMMLSLSILYSFYLVFEAGKLKSVILGLFAYTVLMFIGVYQTILPLAKYNLWEQVLLIGFMLIGSAVIIVAGTKVLKLKKTWQRVLLLVFAFGYIPIAGIFPFQSYYQVTNINIGYLGVIAMLTLVSLGLIHISQKLFTHVPQLTPADA